MTSRIRLHNGLELSRLTALGSPFPTLSQHQWAFESPFSPAVEVGSSELLGSRRALDGKEPGSCPPAVSKLSGCEAPCAYPDNNEPDGNWCEAHDHKECELETSILLAGGPVERR